MEAMEGAGVDKHKGKGMGVVEVGAAKGASYRLLEEENRELRAILAGLLPRDS